MESALWLTLGYRKIDVKFGLLPVISVNFQLISVHSVSLDFAGLSECSPESIDFITEPPLLL